MPDWNNGYVAGAGMLTAEFSLTAGQLLTAVQASGAGTLEIEVGTASSIDIFDITQNAGVSEGAGTSAPLQSNWTLTLYRWQDNEEVSVGFLDTEAFYFQFAAPFESIFNSPSPDKPVVNTWHNTTYRNLLGFQGHEQWLYDSTNEVAYLRASKKPLGVWYAGCPMSNPYGHGKAGHYVTDMRRSVSPLGHIRTLIGNRMRVLEGVYWSHVARDLAINEETEITALNGVDYWTSQTVNAANTQTQSFEQFLKDTQWGDFSLFEVGNIVRLYWETPSPGVDFDAPNRDWPYVYNRYRMLGAESGKLDAAIQSWDRYYTVRLPTLVEVPA